MTIGEVASERVALCSPVRGQRGLQEPWPRVASSRLRGPTLPPVTPGVHSRLDLVVSPPSSSCLTNRALQAQSGTLDHSMAGSWEPGTWRLAGLPGLTAWGVLSRVGTHNPEVPGSKPPSGNLKGTLSGATSVLRGTPQDWSSDPQVVGSYRATHATARTKRFRHPCFRRNNASTCLGLPPHPIAALPSDRDGRPVHSDGGEGGERRKRWLKAR